MNDKYQSINNSKSVIFQKFTIHNLIFYRKNVITTIRPINIIYYFRIY